MSLILIAFALPTFAQAFQAPPKCIDNVGNDLPVINDQVITWKTSTPNQHLERGHVAGIIKEIYPDRNGHTHFSIKIGNGPKDTIEVVYNVEFGTIPTLAVGMQVEACGDYITSTAATAEYQASPDDAIIHYIHKSTSHNHQSGFLIINGAVCGQFRGC